MKIGSTFVNPKAMRMGLVALAGTVLVTGATWRGLAAESAALSASAPSAEQSAAAAAQAPPRVAPGPAALGGRDSYADVVKAVAPAVVTIRTEGRAKAEPTGMDDDDLFRRFFGGRPDQHDGPRMRSPRQRGLGSGVVVSPDGYVLTNYHVVQGAESISVDLADNRTVKATLVGSDKPSDLALLKIDAPRVQPIALGNSDAVQVGDVVLAVGNPLGIGQTVTMGIISAKGRSTGVGDGSYEDFLQTDAPINHGNSGGALVNLKGELVGINSQIVSVSDGNIGIGFAIPANMVRHVMDDLRSSGRVRRARMGVVVQPVTSDLAESLGLKQVGGAIVSSVEAGSAAERAGIRRGDVITSFDGRPVDDSNALRNRVADTAPGSAAKVVINRDGSEREVSVRLDEASPASAANGRDSGDADEHAALGIAVQPLTPERAARAGLDRDAKGLLVEDVDPDGRAAAAGLQPNDVIQEANRKPVHTVDELRAAVRGADRPVLLLVSRGGKGLFLTVRPS